MKPINRKKYSVKILGSDKVYYNKYPYKVRLKDNSINYDIEKSSAIIRYVRDDFHSKHMKMVFNYTRHVYFKTFDAFQEFMYIFERKKTCIWGNAFKLKGLTKAPASTPVEFTGPVPNTKNSKPFFNILQPSPCL